ncbi:unnamed protein product [Danaus chrysippus]|uniref:(African queen) hypothetical protein n=1 Tax=Danaus chrysippus TaxID=151541 RepID=A0A8J2QP11_9NEOP|nr:unnamed protein product [Danaus chrysippus]
MQQASRESLAHVAAPPTPAPARSRRALPLRSNFLPPESDKPRNRGEGLPRPELIFPSRTTHPLCLHPSTILLERVMPFTEHLVPTYLVPM